MFPPLILHAAELVILIFSKVYLCPEPPALFTATGVTQVDKRAANINSGKNSETEKRIRDGGVFKGRSQEVLLGAS